MSDKVKLTPEQHIALQDLQKRHSKTYIIRKHIDVDLAPERHCLYTLSVDQMIRAIHIGYGIKTAYQTGDTVLLNNWSVAVITGIILSDDNTEERYELSPVYPTHELEFNVVKKKEIHKIAVDEDIKDARHKQVHRDYIKHLHDHLGKIRSIQVDESCGPDGISAREITFYVKY